MKYGNSHCSEEDMSFLRNFSYRFLTDSGGTPSGRTNGEGPFHENFQLVSWQWWRRLDGLDSGQEAKDKHFRLNAMHAWPVVICNLRWWLQSALCFEGIFNNHNPKSHLKTFLMSYEWMKANKLRGFVSCSREDRVFWGSWWEESHLFFILGPLKVLISEWPLLTSVK